MKYARKITTQFKKDFKKIRNNLSIVEDFELVVKIIADWEKLPAKYMDHKLKWDYKNARECHIKPDLLLVYEIDNNELILLLLKIWSHSEIF